MMSQLMILTTRLQKVTGVVGQMFGSDLSFGAIDKIFAPGRLSIKDLRNAENYLELN